MTAVLTGGVRSWRLMALIGSVIVGLVVAVIGTVAVRDWVRDRAAATALPPAEGYFDLAPVGSIDDLPGDRRAAAAVHRSSWEPRPENHAYNRTVPDNLTLEPRRVADRAYDPRWNRHVQNRITGNFTGPTDQIFQWAAVKWGLPDNVLRVVAYMESGWMQSNFGDYADDAAKCPEAGMPLPCPVTYGIVGVRSTSWPGLYPWNKDSTAAAVDVFAGWVRGCYEGWVWWLRDHGNRSHGTYRAGDLWGCVGAWFSGDWHDGQVGSPSGQDYIARARAFVKRPPWLMNNF